MEIPAQRPKPSDGIDSGSEDRLTDLPEDLRLRILANTRDVAVAARTSVLSSRWRRLWRLLPGLIFPFPSDPHRVHLALQSHEAPALRLLEAGVLDGTPDSVAPWLLIVAPRLTGRLSLTSRAAENGSAEDMADERGAFELPCCQNAVSIRLELGPLGVSMPPLGVFTRLNDLSLVRVQLHGPCMLGDLVSSPRCPVLRKLIIKHSSGLGNLAIHSDSLLGICLKDVHLHPADALGPGHVTIESKSLLQMGLTSVHSLQQLTVTAPALDFFYVDSCFADYRAGASRHNQPVANIYAPRLKSLYWHDAYDPSSTQFANIENLETLGAYLFRVYGRDDYAPNNYLLRLLKRFQLFLNIRLMLTYIPDITDGQFLIEDIARLPNITRMSLDICPLGHSVGASVFHLLRMSTGLKTLWITLVATTSDPEVQTVCPSGCGCDHPSNWKTEELALNLLEEVEIHELRGTEHEAALIKRLFDWATVLKKMTVTFQRSVNESEAKEFFQMLQSFSRPEICMKGPCFA
ncbi:hypothetical protein QYE76_009544 [Lolium multiflorum]|uniref:F-box domain-containing protein n=1 Tax=Lolium multiflorum TaxID=4521 RepID=A0AAD8TVH3_LOLMU|nr:hypothetical protein QYE76_009544 [Lolium multiflorum]